MALNNDPLPGDPIRAADIKAIRDDIKANRVNVGPGSGLSLSRGPNGTDIWARKYSGVTIMVVTTQISKKSGTTCGTGKATLATFNPVTAVLVAGSGPDQTVYNYHTDVTYKVGSVIGVYLWSGVLWAFDVDACVNLGS